MISTTTLNLSPEELAATVEALHDTLLRRLKWTVYWNHRHWQGLDWDTVQYVVDQLGQAYTKAMMTLHDMKKEVHPDFFTEFDMPDEAWDLLNAVSLAGSWDQAPRHDKCDCAVCFKMARV